MTLKQQIGIGLKNNQFFKCFEKETALPITRIIPNITLNRNCQTEMIIDFFQGEGEDIQSSSMKLLTTVKVPIPKYTLIKDLPMEIVCEITEEYILTITVRNQDTKEILLKHESITIE